MGRDIESKGRTGVKRWKDEVERLVFSCSLSFFPFSPLTDVI